MKNLLGKLNWKLLNASIYITLIMAYLYPFEKSIDESVAVGFPLRFFTIYDNLSYGFNLLTSCNLSVGEFIINVLFYLCLLTLVQRLFFKKLLIKAFSYYGYAFIKSFYFTFITFLFILLYTVR